MTRTSLTRGTASAGDASTLGSSHLRPASITMSAMEGQASTSSAGMDPRRKSALTAYRAVCTLGLLDRSSNSYQDLRKCASTK